jgi:hypothetical protein
MIEHFGVEGDDVRITSLVVGVAEFARLVGGQGI